MVKIKSLSRRVVWCLFWWPTLDEDIESKVNLCDICKQQRSMLFLVVMDAYSLAWNHLHTTTASKTIEVLRNLFAAYRLPKEVVTDHGPQFTSSEFEKSLKLNAVTHIKTPACHSASKGLAERLVQNFKKSCMSLQDCVANFLFSYRKLPSKHRQSCFWTDLSALDCL